jgi:hypothetical protein
MSFYSRTQHKIDCLFDTVVQLNGALLKTGCLECEGFLAACAVCRSVCVLAKIMRGVISKGLFVSVVGPATKKQTRSTWAMISAKARILEILRVGDAVGGTNLKGSGNVVFGISCRE